jgi:FAD binding domain
MPPAGKGLNQQVGGQLIRVQSPLASCSPTPDNESCKEVVRKLQNPYFIGDQAGATQSSGWVDAWSSAPSIYAVAARNTGDVVAAVNFARENNLRLVVKGGGHSYQGTSNASDSLLISTRAMRSIVLHEAFVGEGCGAAQAPRPAVTVEAGAMWIDVYDAVTTKAGRYVQGGGCVTVGVAGLIQSGGFGSFSKNYGMAAAGSLEAEIVTADGAVRTTNACTNPDLFWAIKGGGGGSLGVVTKLTLATRELPAFFGGAFLTIKATSDAAFEKLIGRFLDFYKESLLNPHWGESVALRPDNTLAITMVSHGLDRQQAENVWQPFLDWVAGSPQDLNIPSAPSLAASPPGIGGMPISCEKTCLRGCIPRTGRVPPKTTSGGQAIKTSGDFLARLSIDLAARRTIAKGSTTDPCRCVIREQQALGRGFAFQQRTCGSVA